MRLFAALLIPVEVEAHLDEFLDPLRVNHNELRWVAAGRWHVTLEFLGEVGQHESERQRGRWERRARRVQPFELSLASGGAFPRTWSARVVWAGLGGDLDAWRRLAAYEQSPHVTLARTRQRLDATGVVDGLSGYQSPAWRVDEVALVRSFLRRGEDRGPRYEPIARFPVGG